MIFLLSLVSLVGLALGNGYGVPPPVSAYDPIAQLPPLQQPTGNYYPPSDYNQRHRHHGSHSESSSESDERRSDRCYNCKEIKRTCHEYYGNNDCYRPKIRYMWNENNCTVAVASCTRGRSQGPFTLENKSGDVLFHGYARDHFLYCNRKDRWEARDYRGEKVSVRNLRCIEPRSEYPGGAAPSGPY